MLSTKSIIFGFVLCGLGVGLIAGESYIDVDPALLRPAALGLMVLGVLFFLAGMAGIATLLKPPKGVHRDDTAAAATALIRAMIAISIADGQLDGKEIQITAKIYKKLTGSEIAEDVIRDVAEDMKNNNVQISDEMGRLRDVLGPDLKQNIIKASLYILAADGVVEEKEELILAEIKKGLNVPRGQFNRIKNDFLESKGLAAKE